MSVGPEARFPPIAVKLNGDIEAIKPYKKVIFNEC